MLHQAAGSEDCSDALERGCIVQFARCPVELPSASDQDFLRSGLAPHLRRKNVSFYPDADRVTGLQAPPEIAERARRVLREHSQRVRDFLQRSMPGFTAGWRVGTSSYRPLEEKGRHLSAHASNELVHVDAGAYGATQGDRILRFFVNLNPQADRVWISRGTFAELFAQHGEEANVRGGSLDAGFPERAWSGLLRAAGGAFPMLRVIDTSPYDRRMRRFHNWMKDTPSFQDGPRQQFSFPPFAAWMVLTDGVSHACIAGQHALVDTFLVPLRNCKQPAPYHLLAGARA